MRITLFTKKSQWSLLTAFALFSMATLSAQANEAEIRKAMAQRISGMPAIDDVKETEITGIYELRMGNELLYSDAKGEHLIRGSILRTVDRTDLTAQRADQINRVSFNEFPLANAIVRKKGSGAQKMVVFEDPNCEHCKKFEQDLLRLNDVIIYTIMMPILSADSKEKADAIWCSKDRALAWSLWMEKKEDPKSASIVCQAPSASNLEFAKKHGISGTPTTFFEDGSRTVGAVPIGEIQAKLKSQSKNH